MGISVENLKKALEWLSSRNIDNRYENDEIFCTDIRHEDDNHYVFLTLYEDLGSLEGWRRVLICAKCLHDRFYLYS